MRGIILWVAVGLAAIATGVGLYVTALQTSPATITNPPAEFAPAAVSPAGETPAPGVGDDHRSGDDHGSRYDEDHDD